MRRGFEPLLAFLEESGAKLHLLLTRLTLREDVAEELLQEVFLKLSRSDGFARAANPEGYAYRVATNLALDWRAAQKRKPDGLALLAEHEDRKPSPLDRLIRREELEQILDVAESLSALRREVFVMHHVQQESYDVIADRLGKTPQQIRGLCHKEVREIREFLDEDMSRFNTKEVSHVKD